VPFRFGSGLPLSDRLDHQQHVGHDSATLAHEAEAVKRLPSDRTRAGLEVRSCRLPLACALHWFGMSRLWQLGAPWLAPVLGE
jgi:hypothetical protein